MRGYPSSLKLAWIRCVLISSIINISAIQALATPAHSKPHLLRSTMRDSKAKKKERRDCKLTRMTATKKQVGEVVQQTTPTTTTCKEFTYDNMSQYRYQKWASTSNYCFNPFSLSNMSLAALLPHEGLCETPYDDEEMLEVVWIGTFGDGVPVKP